MSWSEWITLKFKLRRAKIDFDTNYNALFRIILVFLIKIIPSPSSIGLKFIIIFSFDFFRIPYQKLGFQFVPDRCNSVFYVLKRAM